MNYSVSLFLRSRYFHHHAVYSKVKPLFGEERFPSSKHTRNSVDSSSGNSRKKYSKLDIKLATNKKFSDRTVDEKNVPEKANIAKKQQRKIRIEIDEVAAEKMVLYKDSKFKTTCTL